jgi:hypothetical protein
MILSEQVCSSGRMSSSPHEHGNSTDEQDASEDGRDGWYFRRLP